MSAPVEIGFFSLSEVTGSGDHRAYNEWHQLDHLPEQYQLPGIVLGERWVSTPACKQARAFDSHPLDATQYLTLYLMSEPVEETIDSFLDLGKALARAGRFYEHRRSLLSGAFSVIAARSSPRALVSDGVVPFRPNLGVFAVVERLEERATGGWSSSATEERDNKTLVNRLLDQPGVAGVWRFRSLDDGARQTSGPGPTEVTICFLDEPPLVVSENLGEIVNELWRSLPEPELAGPFETITPWKWDWFD